jgi:hypothetical protein
MQTSTQKPAVTPTSPALGTSLEATTIASFVASLLVTPPRSFGYKELLEVGVAVAGLARKNPSDPMLESFNSAMVSKGLRDAIQKCLELDKVLDGIRAGREGRSLKSLDDTTHQIAKLAAGRFNLDSRPVETKLLHRYSETFEPGSQALHPELFSRLVLNGRDSREKTEILVKLAESGALVTEKTTTRHVNELERELALRLKDPKSRLEKTDCSATEQLKAMFGAQEVAELRAYADASARGDGVAAAMEALRALAEYAESTTLAPGLRKMVQDLALLAARCNASAKDGSGIHRIEGISRVVSGCLRALSELSENAGSDPRQQDRALLPAVHGFAAEAATAVKVLERGHLIKSLDETVELPSGASKEIDVIAIAISEKGIRTPFVLEVKSSWAALAHSLERTASRQMIGLGKAAQMLNAIPALVVHEDSAPSAAVALRLRTAIADCKRLTGKDVVVLNKQLQEHSGFGGAAK